MSFADFMMLPPALRLALAVIITAGVTLLVVRLLHNRILAQAAIDGQEKDRYNALKEEAEEKGDPLPPPKPPDQGDLSGRVIGLTMTAFVFLLAFTLGTFWSAAKTASSATEAETANWTRAVILAQALPDAEGGPAIVEALQGYRASVRDVQWPMLQQADGPAAYRAMIEASLPLSKALLQADRAGASQRPEWSALTSAVNDMITQGRSRVDALPGPAAPGVLTLITILGLSNLALTAFFQPARLRPNLFLMGLMASLMALMIFVVVEASNPYVGGARVQKPGFEMIATP